MIKGLLIFLALLAFVGIFILEWYRLFKNARKEKTKISFKEGLDLTELPIVTFNQGTKKLHFLLDTGSNISYINKDVLKTIEAKELPKQSYTSGIGDATLATKHYDIEIGYRNQSFVEEFGAIDLNTSFGAIEKESGIRIHGILGSKFFERYKYIIDFNELMAYR